MRCSSQLPPPPHFDIDVVAERRAPGGAFLEPLFRTCRTRSKEGTLSAEFVYEEVDRKALDAVVVVAHFLHSDKKGNTTRYVILRSAVRPPVVLRRQERSPIPEPGNRALWELVAGLVEAHASGAEAPSQAAARELFEEAGFQVDAQELKSLGPSSFPSPGVIAERHFFFQVEVDPRKQSRPTLDGSPLEEAGELIAVPLHVALDAARRGLLADAKTELGLRRFSEYLEHGQ